MEQELPKRWIPMMDLMPGAHAVELRRKQFVRNFALAREKRRLNYLPRKSKDPFRDKLKRGIREVIDKTISVDQWRLRFVLQANRAWEKQLIREWGDDKPTFSYADLKQFIRSQPWSSHWPDRQIAALWRTVCRTGHF